MCLFFVRFFFLVFLGGFFRRHVFFFEAVFDCIVLFWFVLFFATRRALSREAVKAIERGADVRQAVLVKNAMIKKTVLKVGRSVGVI